MGNPAALGTGGMGVSTPVGDGGAGSSMDSPSTPSFGGKRKRPGLTKPPKSFRTQGTSIPGSKADENGRAFKPYPKRTMQKGFPKR